MCLVHESECIYGFISCSVAVYFVINLNFKNRYYESMY